MSELQYAIRHETVYAYDGEVAHSHQQLHLTPRASPRQRCLEHAIRVAPLPATQHEYLDAFGNRVTRFELDRPHDRLEVVAEMLIALAAAADHPPGDAEGWQQVREQLCYSAKSRPEAWLDAMRFRAESPYVRIKRAFSDFARDCLRPDAGVLDVADALMRKVHTEFTYAPGETDIATPLLEVLERRRGVCQDFAHVMIACLRSVGLAARYVSGYLRTQPAPDSAPTTATAPTDASSALVGADASHAWVAVYAPPLGWIEFDPTNNLLVGQDHVALAWGRDFGDVSPLRGVILGGGAHSPSVRVTVRPHDTGG